ncbi:MAG: DUF4417 domain-containing protein [Selenomonadaceae bacterium]|nr:DUF4417 domain-containing protein [Selenomonadaceae bacterium]
MDYDEFKSWLEILLCNPPVEGDYPTTGKYNFPQLAQVNYIPEEPVYPLNYLKSTVAKGRYWYHCFTAERNFHRLYNSFSDYVELLRQAKGIISADFSLFRDYPEEVLIAKCRANRLVDYALQQAGIPMIPTAGFAGESSWEWCFDGLPHNSTVAVTTNCLGRDREAHRLFIGGINAMVEKIHPTAIVVCGKVPAWLPKRHPNIQIIHIPGYSEMWHEREKRKLIGRRKPTGKMILKGGYGGESGKARRKKDGCYKDSHDEKVTDKNAIIAAEYYMSLGMYVVFLHEKPEEGGRPDLLVDYEFMAEVKGIISSSSSTISKQLKKASNQISDELARLPEDKQLPSKIVIISFHETFEAGFKAINEGYQEAKRKNQVHFPVEFWFRGESGMEIRVLE